MKNLIFSIILVVMVVTMIIAVIHSGSKLVPKEDRNIVTASIETNYTSRLITSDTAKYVVTLKRKTFEQKKIMLNDTKELYNTNDLVSDEIIAVRVDGVIYVKCDLKNYLGPDGPFEKIEMSTIRFDEYRLLEWPFESLIEMEKKGLQNVK